MKKIVLALAVAVASVAAASAQTPAAQPAMKTPSQSKPATMAPKADAKAAAKAMAMKAEVVSTDAAAKTITVKDAAGANMTLTATGGAVASLAKLKAGDWVMVTHSDMTATKIAKVKATGTAAKKGK